MNTALDIVTVINTAKAEVTAFDATVFVNKEVAWFDVVVSNVVVVERLDAKNNIVHVLAHDFLIDLFFALHEALEITGTVLKKKVNIAIELVVVVEANNVDVINKLMICLKQIN